MSESQARKRGRDDEQQPPNKRRRIVEEYFTDLGRELKLPELEKYVDKETEAYLAGNDPEVAATDDEAGSDDDFEEVVDERFASTMQLDPTDFRELAYDERDRSLLPPPMEEKSLLALKEMHARMRDNLRETVSLEQRKPTFYNYVHGDGGKGLGRLWTVTPQTEAARAIVEEDDEGDVAGSEFSLIPVDLGARPEPAKRGRKANNDRTRISATRQGPHTVAHSFIDTILEDACPDTPDRTPRDRWGALEVTFATQVDSPEAFSKLVEDEIGAQDVPGKADAAQRVKQALVRYQELFNDVEGRLNAGQVDVLLAEQGVYGGADDAGYEEWAKGELRSFRDARAVLAEIMELSPFGSYAWQREKGANRDELARKGESRAKLKQGLADLRKAKGGPGWEEALDAFAAVLAESVDGATGKFESEDAYKAFLRVRLELVGEPAYADVLLEKVLGLKQ